MGGDGPTTPAAGKYSQIRYSVDAADGVGWVTLDRPGARNAFSRIMTQEVDDALTRATEDPRVRCIVLHGAGPCFSSGHDLGSQEQLEDLRRKPYEAGMRGDYQKWSDLDVEMCLRWRQLPKPLLCGVHSYCVYHACAVASCADIVIAADDARFMPSLVEATFLPWDVPPRRAKEIMMMQRFVLAPEAVELGVAHRVVPRDRLHDELRATARHLATVDSFHLRMMKAACNHAQDAPGLAQGVRATLSHWAAYRAGADDPSSRAPRGRPGTDNYTTGDGAKRFAPVKQAGDTTGVAWRWAAEKSGL